YEAKRLQALPHEAILDTPSEEAFDDIALLAAQVCHTPIALVNLVDGKRHWFQSQVGVTVEQVPPDSGFCSFVLSQREVLVIADMLADERFAHDPLVTSDPYLRFYAGVPLIASSGHVVGALCVADTAPRDLDAAQRAALQALARQAVAQLELRRRTADVERPAPSSQQSEELFRQLAENIRDVFFVSTPTEQMVYISPMYEEIWGRSCESLYENPWSWTDAIHPGDRLRIAESIKRFDQEGQFDEEFRIVRPDGAVRWVRARAFALRDETGDVYRIVGVAQDVTERKQTEDALKQMTYQLQTLSRRLLEAQEVERRRIARELHDELGQSLTAVKIILQTAQRLANVEPLAGWLDEGINVVSRTLQQVRDLSLDLRPSILDDLGLVAALRWYVDRTAQRTGLIIRFVADPVNGRLPPDVETASFRVAQEALTNVARHAHAKKVTVKVRQRDGELHLTISDDGIGFDVEAAQQRAAQGESLGLLGMQERVSLVGGRLTIQSTPQGGTTVQVVVPTRRQGSGLAR
ncbi:MAG: PAS domain-containing protein, partial [Abditibacteriales bacterium]|nr:PAS domain-containing protein [Abditibacteriales bacterium]MDW8367874.1 PAS domain-containing protein [Abditibacteriales bacterium]